ncbi:MAG TPA: YidB family protein [Steroidobacteraceae bacterium]|nr:YidB family protein [Steroidobacteraceae bacterium]
MGFLDTALGSLLSATSAPAQQAPIAQALGTLLQQHGGIGGLVNQLSQGGLAGQVSSWIGTGQNQAVTGTEIAQALGSGSIGHIAQQLGINPQEAGNLLAQVVPHLIDHMTPGGQLPANAGQVPQSDVLVSAVSAIATRLLR